MKSDTLTSFGFVAVLTLSVLACASAFYAPCGCYAGAKRAETPARCFNDFRGPNE